MSDQNIVKPEKTKKNKGAKCAVCKKRLKLMPFICKCEKKFCMVHVHPEEHDCTFDHKTYQRNQLEKTLIKCVNEKVIQI